MVLCDSIVRLKFVEDLTSEAPSHQNLYLLCSVKSVHLVLHSSVSVSICLNHFELNS